MIFCCEAGILLPGLNINSGKAMVISLLRFIHADSVFPAENQVGDPVGDQNEADGKGKNQANGFFSQNDRNDNAGGFDQDRDITRPAIRPPPRPE